MIIVVDRDTPAQLYKINGLNENVKRRYLPMNENLAALIHDSRDPLNNFLKVATNVLGGRIC